MESGAPRESQAESLHRPGLAEAVVLPPNEDPAHAHAQRPTIRIAGGELSRNVDDAERALITSDCGLYQRGGFIVRPTKMQIPTADGRKTIGSRLVTVKVAHIRESMTRAARWEKLDPRGKPADSEHDSRGPR
jgi:hypothetical protein